MSLDVTGLPAYIDQNRDDLIGQVVAGAKSVRVLDLQTGFKSAGAINILSTDAVFQDGAACGFNANGTTALSQRILTVGSLKVQENLCPKDLNSKYTQHQVKAGSKDDEIPFAEKYTAQKTSKINKASEKAIWQGDTGSGDANLNKFDGLLKIIDAATGVIEGNTGAETAITVANAVEIVQAMYNAIPADLIEAEGGDNDTNDLAILCGSDFFRTYINALIGKNLYHYDATSTNLEIMVPGTNVKLMALGGLTGTNRLVAGRIGTDGGFVVGTDLENEDEQFKMWYSDDDDLVKFDTRWKMGTQIKFPNEIVEFTLAV